MPLLHDWCSLSASVAPPGLLWVGHLYRGIAPACIPSPLRGFGVHHNRPLGRICLRSVGFMRTFGRDGPPSPSTCNLPTRTDLGVRPYGVVRAANLAKRYVSAPTPPLATPHRRFAPQLLPPRNCLAGAGGAAENTQRLMSLQKRGKRKVYILPSLQGGEYIDLQANYALRRSSTRKPLGSAACYQRDARNSSLFILHLNHL